MADTLMVDVIAQQALLADHREMLDTGAGSGRLCKGYIAWSRWLARSNGSGAVSARADVQPYFHHRPREEVSRPPAASVP
jgi:hypothetical protein